MASPLVEALIEDLKRWSKDLLDHGLGSSDAAIRGPSGSLGALDRRVRQLASLVTRCLSELGPDAVLDGIPDLIPTRRPIGARLSRSASDFTHAGGRLVPTRWLRVDFSPQLPEGPLRWLKSLLLEERQLVVDRREAARKRIEEAWAARKGSSVWADADRDRLSDHIKDYEASLHALDHALAAIRGAYTAPLTPNPNPPRPYPRTPAWAALRRHALQRSDPHSLLPEVLRDTLSDDVTTIDPGHLYQRWVGMQVIHHLRNRGWQPDGDPIGTIFLGGRLVFHRREASFEMWSEARLHRKHEHGSGFTLVGLQQELMPDYLFVTPGSGGREAFVLDATLNTTERHTRAKADKYMRSLSLARPPLVAGCPVHRSPRLSWIAGPSRARSSKAFVPDGSTGIVPMHPLDQRDKALGLWLREVTRQAEVWSGVQQESDAVDNERERLLRRRTAMPNKLSVEVLPPKAPPGTASPKGPTVFAIPSVRAR